MILGRGPKDKINEAITAGQLVPGNMVVTTGEKADELILIERDNSKVVITPRTQQDINVVGVNLSDGVANGKVIPAGSSIEDFIKMLVQKRIAATYKAPTITIANNGGQASNTTVEAGSTVDIKVKSTFTANDAGALTSHKIIVAGTEVLTGADETLEYDNTLVVTDGTNNITSSATYEDGAVKNDNFGDASPNGQIKAGTKTSSNFTITGARKAFYGATDGELPTIDSAYIRALPGSVLAPEAGSKINVVIAEGQQHLIVSIPSNRTVAQITYVDLGDKNMLDKFNVSTVAVAGASDSVEADTSNLYIYSMAAPAQAAMNFELLLA